MCSTNIGDKETLDAADRAEKTFMQVQRAQQQKYAILTLQIQVKIAVIPRAA